METIDEEKSVPSLTQAKRLKKGSQAGGLDRDEIHSIMAGEEASGETDGPQESSILQEEDEPDETIQPTIPTSSSHPRRVKIADDIAALKNPNKKCICTPQMFLDAFSEFSNRFCREIDVFRIPYYELVFPTLSPEEIEEFHQLEDTIHTAAEAFYQYVKGMNKNHE